MIGSIPETGVRTRIRGFNRGAFLEAELDAVTRVVTQLNWSTVS